MRVGNSKEIFFVRLFIILDCKNNIIHFNNLRGRGVNPNFVYFTHTCVRGFVATPPFITILMFIIMFTFVVFSHQLTLPFPSSWNIDVNFRSRIIQSLHHSLHDPTAYNTKSISYTRWINWACISGVTSWSYKLTRNTSY